MKHLTTEQINIISEMILNEQISFNSDKIQATDSTTYANNQEDPGAVHNTYRWFGQNSTTLWLAALGVGLVVLPPALRKYASNKLRRELPKGTQITEKMRLKYFLRDMISNGLLSHIPVAGKYLSVPSYLEELKKQLKKEVERTKSTLTDPKSSRATKQAARESLNYMEHIPGVLDGYKLKLMNQAVSEYYTNPKFTINDLLRTTGWAADAKLATKAQVRMPILKKIFDKKYIPQEVPAQLIPGQMKFNKYLESQPNLQKSLDKNEREVNATKLVRISSFNGYDFENKPGYVDYTVCDYFIRLAYYEDTQLPVLDDKGVQMYTICKIPIQTGTIDLTEDLVNQWGADDQIVFDYVIQQLNL